MSVNSGLVQDSRIVQRILCDNIMNRDMLMKICKQYKECMTAL